MELMQFFESTTRIHTEKWVNQNVISCETTFIFVNYTFVSISTTFSNEFRN